MGGWYVGGAVGEGGMNDSSISTCFSLGVGFTDGSVYLLDSLTLEDVCPPFRYSRDAVTFIAFSHDSNYMATTVGDLLLLYCSINNITFSLLY